MIDNKLLNNSSKIFKNSLWLTLQPLILNIISIAVIGYIARALGESDYGKFIFAFTFVSLFMPFMNMGLSSITTREIAENKEKAGILIEKLIALRLFLVALAVIAIIIIINLMGYPQDTKVIVFLAALTLVSYAISITMNSVFQGFEKMKYIAYYQFISGIVLTVCSVLVLLAGYHLVGLTLVYVGGSFLGTIMAVYYAAKIVKVDHIRIDFTFWRENVNRGVPFLVPGLLMLIGMKIGIIMLSKFHGDIAVGVYGAANTLIEKLMAIPDGVCTAIFPALAALSRVSRAEAAALFEKFFQYSFLLALPIAVGTAILARPIILGIFGSQYVDSIPVLQVLIWWFFFMFLTSIQSWALSAVHHEKKVAGISLITMLLYLVFNLLLVPSYKEIGTAAATVVVSAISFGIYTALIRRHLSPVFLKEAFYLKVLSANIIMGSVTYLLKDQRVYIPLAAGAMVYTFAILGLNTTRLENILQFYRSLHKKDEVSVAGSEI